MQTQAIFDNTVFNIAARIESCDLIALATNLFADILVPQAIFQEIQSFPTGYEPYADRRMQSYERAVLQKQNSLRLCTTYDIVELVMVQTIPNVDRGEAEAIAQAQKRFVKLFFTDDEKCISALQNRFLAVDFVSTLHLIALLDIQNFLPDYKEVVREYLVHKPLNRKTGKAKFRADYQKALHYFGLPNDKKLLNDKTSLKKLGL
jgi:predicted nucleic acid-binding protein